MSKVILQLIFNFKYKLLVVEKELKITVIIKGLMKRGVLQLPFWIYPNDDYLKKLLILLWMFSTKMNILCASDFLNNPGSIDERWQVVLMWAWNVQQIAKHFFNQLSFSHLKLNGCGRKNTQISTTEHWFSVMSIILLSEYYSPPSVTFQFF